MTERLFLVGIFVVTVLAADAVVTRCTDRKTDRLSLQCPRRTVIYQPSVFLGVSITRTCTHEAGNCKGWTQELLRKRNKCFWKRRCNLHWITQIPLASSQNHSCVGKIPSYVAYDQHKCVKKSLRRSIGYGTHKGPFPMQCPHHDRHKIYSICTFTQDITKVYKGVIRSHDHYPETYESLKGQVCNVELKPKSRHALRLMVDEVYLGDHDHIIVLHHQEQKTVRLLRTNRTKDKTITVEDGYLEISFFVSYNASSYAQGFIIRFENVMIPVPQTTKTNYTVVRRRLSGNAPQKNAPSIFDPIRKESTVTLTCPTGQVIYNPDIVAVKISKKRGELHPRDEDCQGRYFNLVTEVNRCFWQTSCHVTKVPNQIFTSTSSVTCLALTPNHLATKGYDCLPKESVVDMCNHEVKYVNSTHGIIKSHYNYPWHYPTRRTICRKKIRVDGKYGLRVFTEEMDLDPATRGDNIKIFHLNPRRRLVKKLVSSQTIDIRFTSGTVEIQFKVSRRSTGGQGFLLKFEPILEPKSDVPDSDVQSYPNKKINVVSYNFVGKDCKDGLQNIRAMLWYARGYVEVPVQRKCNNKMSKRLSHHQNKTHSSNKKVDRSNPLNGRRRYKKGKTDKNRRRKNGGKSDRPNVDSINWAATSDW